MNKKLLLATTLTGVVLVTSGITASSVGAQNQNTAPDPVAEQTESTGENQKGFFHKMLDPAKLAEMKAQHEALAKEIEEGDYAEWKTLMEQYGRTGPLYQKITQDNFARFAEMHKLLKEAAEKMQAANDIRTELGLELPGHPGKRLKNHFFKGAGKMHFFEQKLPDSEKQNTTGEPQG